MNSSLTDWNGFAMNLICPASKVSYHMDGKHNVPQCTLVRLSIVQSLQTLTKHWKEDNKNMIIQYHVNICKYTDHYVKDLQFRHKFIRSVSQFTRLWWTGQRRPPFPYTRRAGLARGVRTSEKLLLLFSYSCRSNGFQHDPIILYAHKAKKGHHSKHIHLVHDKQVGCVSHNALLWPHLPTYSDAVARLKENAKEQTKPKMIK